MREVDVFLKEVGVEPELFHLFEADFTAQEGTLTVYVSPESQAVLKDKKLASVHFPRVILAWPVVKLIDYDNLVYL